MTKSLSFMELFGDHPWRKNDSVSVMENPVVSNMGLGNIEKDGIVSSRLSELYGSIRMPHLRNESARS